MSETSDDGDPRANDLRSFGRRRGRKMSPRQQTLLDEVLPHVRIEIRAPHEAGPTPHPGGRHSLPDPPVFIDKKAGVWGRSPQAGAGGSPPAQQQVWLEIGFGGGEHLVWQAAHNPDVLIIGCEPFEEGVAKVLTQIEARRLDNIRLHPDDARPLLRALPDASIARAFILFPDPWPKRKHQKRRLINDALLVELARVMRHGAQLRIGTDIADYARTILMAFQQCPKFVWAARSADDWRRRPADWPATRYEQKAVREGRRSVYLTFARA